MRATLRNGNTHEFKVGDALTGHLFQEVTLDHDDMDALVTPSGQTWLLTALANRFPPSQIKTTGGIKIPKKHKFIHGEYCERICLVCGTPCEDAEARDCNACGAPDCSLVHHADTPEGRAMVSKMILALQNDKSKRDKMIQEFMSPGNPQKVLDTMEQEHGKVADMVAPYSTVTEATQEVIGWAQAVLTALNGGSIAKDSLLHLKLREVVIAYRETISATDKPTFDEFIAGVGPNGETETHPPTHIYDGFKVLSRRKFKFPTSVDMYVEELILEEHGSGRSKLVWCRYPFEKVVVEGKNNMLVVSRYQTSSTFNPSTGKVDWFEQDSRYLVCEQFHEYHKDLLTLSTLESRHFLCDTLERETPSVEVRDTTNLRNNKWRTKQPATLENRFQIREYQPEKITVKCGTITIDAPNAPDGFGAIVIVDGKDAYTDLGLAYRTVDVRFREGECISVTLECIPIKTPNSKEVTNATDLPKSESP